MAGNGDRVGATIATARLDETDLFGGTTTNSAGATGLIIASVIVIVVVVMVVVVMVERVEDTVCSTLHAAAEGVVLAVVVVVTHISFVMLVDCNVYFFGWAATLVLDVVSVVGAAAVVSLSNVELVL